MCNYFMAYILYNRLLYCGLPTQLLDGPGMDLRYNFRAAQLKSEHKIMD